MPAASDDLNQHKLRVYPNPAGSSLWVSEAYNSLLISDMSGKIVLRSQAQHIELRLSPGLYQLSLLDNQGRVSVQKLAIY